MRRILKERTYTPLEWGGLPSTGEVGPSSGIKSAAASAMMTGWFGTDLGARAAFREIARRSAATQFDWQEFDDSVGITARSPT